MKARPHIAVVGAGAFGGWTALHLLERGAQVTLLDAWGAGNSRASSGGETRIMRGTYGPDQPYTAMAARALFLWAKYERKWKQQFLHRTGVLWMASERDDVFEGGSVGMLRSSGIKHRQLSAAQMKKRWPQINFEDIEWGIFEPECGYLERASKLPGGSRRIRGGWGQVSAGRSWSRRARERTALGVVFVGRFETQSGRFRFCLRAMAGKVVSSNYRTSGDGDKAGHIFLWRAAWRFAIQR